jgi:hypothetical protein
MKDKVTRSRRLVGEFLLIVAGVTVALAADSWRAARGEHEREADYLAQLRADLSENRQRLESSIEREKMQGEAALAALRAVQEGRAISLDSALVWMVDRRAFAYSDPRLLTGTFSGIIASGDIHLVRDPGIRTTILAYLPQIDEDKAEFDRWVDFYLEGAASLRRAASDRVDYAPDPGVPAAHLLVNNPSHPSVLPSLDAAVFANEARSEYLRRMLAATIAAERLLSGG